MWKRGWVIYDNAITKFKFTNEKDEPIEGIETVTDMSFKKAVKSVQNKIKDKWVIIEYLTKKGKEIRSSIRKTNRPILWSEWYRRG